MTTGVIALIGLVVLFVGWIVGLILPELRYISWGLLAIGAVFIAAAVILDYRRVGRALVSRRGRFGTGTTLMVSVFTGIIILANAISTGNFYRFDTTGLSQYTLSSQTKGVLAELDQDIEVLLFTVPADELGIGAYATSMLDEYENFTSKLDVTVVDPDQHPDQARLYGITEYHSVVFKGDFGERLISPIEVYLEAEHAFTSAILEVTGTVQLQIYFLTGHGEADIYDPSPGGYSSVREGLKDNLFKTAPLDLLVSDEVPGDAAVLVLAGPSSDQPLTDRELQLIIQYMLDGGRLLVLANPDRPANINRILAGWGVLVGKGTIIDPTSYSAPNIDSPSVDRTNNIFGLATTYFPGAAEIILLSAEFEDFVRIEPLLWTTGDAYIDKDYDPNLTPQFDAATDEVGSRMIGVAVALTPPASEDTEEEAVFLAELIVIGDSDFASNQHFFNGGNSDLFLTSVNWLTTGSDLISIDRKFLQTRRLILRPEAKAFIDVSSMALLPLLIFAAGGVIWYRRR